MGASLILRKTFADFSKPLVLVGYFAVFLGVLFFLALGFANDQAENVATLPLAQQEAMLREAFLPLAFLWGAGIPILLLGAVLGASSLAKEAEHGTLRILLSKPVRRWEVLLGTAGAIVAFLLLVGLASLLTTGLALYEFSGISAAALRGGVFDVLPASLAFTLLVAVVVASVGVALGVFTANRLRTGLGALVLPALYFVFFPVRALSSGIYEDYHLYLVDVNYHFGNAFVVIHETVGGGLDAEAQAALAVFTGVYDAEQAGAEELPASLDYVGHVPPTASLAALLLGSLALFLLAGYRFQRMDL